MSLGNNLTRARRQIVPRARVAALRLLPNTPVRRTVQGVQMVLPRRHVLPLMATDTTVYGRNLVALARSLGRAGNLCVLDVGANVGDSTLQILDATPAHVVCVEPDPEWLRYLHLNVDGRDDVSIEPSILLGPGVEANVTIVHEDDGSSRLERTDDDAAHLAAITTDELVERHPQLRNVRLVKTDTDGYDVMLVPALAQSLRGSYPVIFFEFDPVQTRVAMPELEPSSVFTELLRAGYERAVLWNNGGHFIGEHEVSELAELSAIFDRTTPQERGFHFWDIAVAHADDTAGLRALHDAVAATRGQ